MADSEKLSSLVRELGGVCERRLLKVNVGRSKGLKFMETGISENEIGVIGEGKGERIQIIG